MPRLLEVSCRSRLTARRRMAARLSPRAKIVKRYLDEDLLEDLFRVYRHYRGKPRYNQHKFRGGKISPQTIRDRFGTWGNVCKAFKGYLLKKEIYNDEMPLAEEREAARE